MQEPSSLVSFGWTNGDNEKLVTLPPGQEVVEEKIEKPEKESGIENDKARDRINKAFIDAGLLLSNLALEKILTEQLGYDRLVDLAKEKSVFMVTKEFIEEFFQEEKTDQEFSFVIRKGKPARAAHIEPKFLIHSEDDITGKSTSSGTIENFTELFRDRYRRLKDVLMERVMLKDVIDIEDVKRYDGREVKIIGMIRDIRESKKGNLLLELEDTTGTVLVVGINELKEKGTILVKDEVVGVVGVAKNGIIIAKEILEPDIPTTKRQPECDEPVSVAFLSDIHVGSLLFMEREFQRFIDWLNLQNPGEQKDIAQGIKYLLLAGDLVDGIGIYPGQETELAIPDIYKQYGYLSKLLEQIPEYIEVILSVGNHDAVRRCEPQPSLNGFMDTLKDRPNFHFVGNPCRVNLHGFEVLMYHGTSMDAMISSMSQLSYREPEKAQIEYLKKRHLSPIYGAQEQIAPEERDYMVIDSVPDIFHCGHVHKNGYANYRGVLIVNSGTWQAQTDYQQQQGHMPTPCKLPVLDLRNFQMKVVNFA
ncbi:MAG: DNA-directed DNA polymerase II small subunit [Candidatus Altiarchaeota archaeon]|nr:DNA-directed DNA polymerase II small subunit [Candidatus Altiarchaeota archaeon]